MKFFTTFFTKLENAFRERNPYDGFTMIEALVGITIVVLAITGPLYVAVRSTGYAKQSRNAIEARYFAERTIEKLRNGRDSQFLHCLFGDTPNCALQFVSAGVYETSSEAAWRIFSAPLITLGAVTEDWYINQNYITGGGLYTLTPSASPRKYIVVTTYQALNSVPSCLSGSYDCIYNIDLRVKVEVSFTANGQQRKVSLVDFIRPRM